MAAYVFPMHACWQLRTDCPDKYCKSLPRQSVFAAGKNLRLMIDTIPCTLISFWGVKASDVFIQHCPSTVKVAPPQSSRNQQVIQQLREFILQIKPRIVLSRPKIKRELHTWVHADVWYEHIDRQPRCPVRPPIGFCISECMCLIPCLQPTVIIRTRHKSTSGWALLLFKFFHLCFDCHAGRYVKHWAQERRKRLRKKGSQAFFKVDIKCKRPLNNNRTRPYGQVYLQITLFLWAFTPTCRQMKFLGDGRQICIWKIGYSTWINIAILHQEQRVLRKRSILRGIALSKRVESTARTNF